MTDARAIAALVEEAHRRHWSAVLASTVRLTRDIDLAEDCAQEAYVKALAAWPAGVPDAPAGWLTTVARREALDRLRREATLRRKLPLVAVEADRDAAAGVDALVDRPGPPADLLRLVFTCCHPALGQESQIALTLRLMCGLTTAEIAASLLIKESAAAARITRAKKKIAAAGIPFKLPLGDEMPARLDAVLAVVHLAYTAGHVARGEELVRSDLTRRALDLSRTLVRLMPNEPEARGLLGLLLLTEARGPSRLGADGELVLLADQDRGRWDTSLVSEGLDLATQALRQGEGRFTLQAAIAGLHAIAPSWDLTDWPRVVMMYDALLTRWPSPVVALNRAAAHSFLPGSDLEEVLAELDGLSGDPALCAYSYLPAARADVLARLGRRSEAAAAYRSALALTYNETERDFLLRRAVGLTS